MNKISFNFINLIILILFNFIKSAKITESLKCLQVNQYNGIRKGEKIIGNKNKCFEVSKQCCFINITHNYGQYELKHEYCNYLNVNIKEFEKFLYNMYNDDEMFYANFTAHNLEMYKTIGRNLESNLTQNFDCFLGPQTNEEYSTYVVNNCKEFVDDICTGQKNNTEFNAFVENFQKNYAEAYCNKKQDKKKCVRYNGAQGNDKMVKPLLEELADYLQADNDEYQVEINETNIDINPDETDDDGNSTYLTEWKIGNITVKCKPRPNVSVTVECPDGYVYQEFINFKLIKYLLFTLILIL